MDNSRIMSLTLAQFSLGRCLGKGSFSKVHYARFNAEQKQNDAQTSYGHGMQKENEYAVKIVDKNILQKRRYRLVPVVMNEKRILQELEHIHILKLYATFMSTSHLFFVLDLCCKSHLGHIIQMTHDNVGERAKNIAQSPNNVVEGISKYYLKQLLSAIEYLHSRNIVHRDIKPSNILIKDHSQYQHRQKHVLKLADFGFASSLETDHEPFYVDFVGSPNYSPPEKIDEIDTMTFASDLWAFGCVIFEFVSNSVFVTHGLCKVGDFMDSNAIKLALSLLKEDPMDRLGSDAIAKSGKYIDIFEHSFFQLGTSEDEVEFFLPNLQNQAYDNRKHIIDGSNSNWEFLLEVLEE